MTKWNKIALNAIRNLIIDMDGVLWRGDVPMPGLVEFFDTMRRKSVKFVLATNNASKSGTQFASKLRKMGVEVSLDEILTSPQATATYLSSRSPNARVFVIGEEGLKIELRAKDLYVVEDGETQTATHVVVGIDTSLTYAKLAKACLLIRNGATFIGTNPDVTFPDPRGIVPGNGAILAALRVSTDVEPIIIGKPQPEMMVQAMQRMDSDASDTAVLGDRLDTDILGGQNAGLASILVLSGVTTADDARTNAIQADYVFEDIREVAKRL
jgi:4-nitrophenyl phosphatase